MQPGTIFVLENAGRIGEKEDPYWAVLSCPKCGILGLITRKQIAGLIAVIVIDQDGFDVRHFEAHAFDVLLHGFGGVCGTRAHHDVTLRRGQKENFSIGVADEIKVPDDLEWLRRAGQIRDLPSDFQRLRGQFFSDSGLFGCEWRIGCVSLGLENHDGGADQKTDYEQVSLHKK